MNLEKIIDNFPEPDWLKSLRKKNLNLFYTQPFPQWKRLNISSLRLEELDFSAKGAEQFFDYDDGIVLVDSKNLKNKIFQEYAYLHADLSFAVRFYPEILKKFFERNLIKGEDGKFQSLGNSLWKNGFYLHVKSGSKIEKPITGKNLSIKEKTLINKTIIYAENNSEFTFIEDFQSEEMDENSLKISLLEIYLEPGASAKIITLNRRKAKGWDFFFKKAYLGDSSHLYDISIELGNGNTIGNFSLSMNEKNSIAEIGSIITAMKQQKFDLLFEIVHNSPETKSSIFSRGIVGEKGKGVWRGLTHVKKGATGANVSQKGEILLTGEEAKADAIPSLWIDENDCRASHGASVFPLNLEKIFYLESRGIEPSIAKTIIGKGFLMSVLNNLHFRKEEIEEIIEEKLKE